MGQDFDDAQDEDDEMEECAKAFYEMLDSSKRPLHAHTKLCQLDAITQLMALKAQFNLGTDCYNAITTLIGQFLPKDHVMPANLYQSIKSSRYLRCSMSRYMLVRMDVHYLGKSMQTKTIVPNASHPGMLW